jgi:hypothetical protein
MTRRAAMGGVLGGVLKDRASSLVGWPVRCNTKYEFLRTVTWAVSRGEEVGESRAARSIVEENADCFAIDRSWPCSFCAKRFLGCRALQQEARGCCLCMMLHVFDAAWGERSTVQ